MPLLLLQANELMKRKKIIHISCATAISDGELIENWNKKNMRQIREREPSKVVQIN